MARPRTIVVSLLLQRAASFGYFPGSAMSEPGSAADPLHIACGYDYSMNGPGSNHYYYLDGGNAGSTVSINTCGSSQDLMIQVYESSATFDAIADGSMDWGSYASNNYGDAVINQDDDNCGFTHSYSYSYGDCSYGGWLCSYGEVYKEDGCSDDTCGDCESTYGWDVYSNYYTGSGFDCWSPDGGTTYYSFTCSDASSDRSEVSFAYFPEDSTCTMTDTTYTATLGPCDESECGSYSYGYDDEYSCACRARPDICARALSPTPASPFRKGTPRAHSPFSRALSRALSLPLSPFPCAPIRFV